MALGAPNLWAWFTGSTLIHWRHTARQRPAIAKTRCRRQKARYRATSRIARRAAPDNSSRAQPIPFCYLGPVSATASDDPRLSWADAKYIVKMILRSAQT